MIKLQTKLFKKALKALLKQKTSDKHRDITTTIVDHLLMYKTTVISTGRGTGKTEFLSGSLRNGDLYFHKHKNSGMLEKYPFRYDMDTYLNSVDKGVKLNPCRVIFFDEVYPSKEILTTLYQWGAIDRKTAVLSLMSAGALC